MMGGDFAGYVGKFSPSDGALIPLPLYLVPEDLREWGQEPSSLEILVSEETTKSEDDDEEELLLQRQTITVLPAIGCGVDNLETTKSEEIYQKEDTVSWSDSNHPSVRAMDATILSSEGAQKLRLETLFALPEAHRVRVSFDLQIQQQQPKEGDNGKELSYEIQSPIQIQLERQTSETSTKGTRADGGGLDGRTVSTLLGDRLRQQLKFAELKPATEGSWKSVDDSSATVLSPLIHLPGNITIASGPGEDQEWILEVSHFTSSTSSDNALEGTRRTLQRTFQGFESSTKYSEEAGEFLAE